MKLIVKAICGAVQSDIDDLTEDQILEAVDGLSNDNDFVEYLDDDYCNKLESGYMSFKVINGKLYVMTTYEVNERLTSVEMDKLAEYTQGQWSDGIGESFEQFPRTELELYISPWYRDQKIEYYTV